MTFVLWLALGEWRAQPLRNALSVTAIAIGVALGFAIHLVNAVALDDFTGGINRLRGAADLAIVAAEPAGFDESLFGTLMASDVAASIAEASPVVERDVTLGDDPSTVLHVSGVDALRAARVTPLLIGRPEHASPDGGDPSAATLGWFDADAIHVPPALLAALGRKVGESLALRVDGDVVELRIAGTLADDDTPTTTTTSRTTRAHRTWRASMDIAGAQWRLHRLGRLSRIDLRLVEGSDIAAVRDAIARSLPADVRITDAGDDRARSGDLSRAYRVNLDMLALMALFTGAFLVYSTQSLAVARRRAQLALLRVIGTTRRRLVAQVLIEGVAQGIVGGLLGLGGGLVFAAVVLRFFGGDLGSGAFAKSGFDVHRLLFAAPEAAVLFFLLGFAAALAGSWFPARSASLAAPAAALKSAGSDDPSRLVSPWVAVALLAAGLVAATLPAIGGLPIAGYVSMALLLFGGIAAMPWIARRILGVFMAPFATSARPRPVAIDLALRRLWAAPSAASVALCGIVASASLMVAMTVMIGSFRHSVDAWLGQLLSADLYLRTDPAGGGLADTDVARLRHVAGVAHVDLQKVVPLTLDPTKPSVSMIARTMDRDDPARSIPLISHVALPANGDIPVWVSEAVVDLYHARLAQPLALPIGATAEPRPRFVVAGVWRDYARQFGSVVMRREDYTRLTGDDRFTDAAVNLQHGADPEGADHDGADHDFDTLEAALRAALPDALRADAEFARPAAIRALSLRIFDRSFAVTYLLQAVAIAIGLAGVAATFSAQTFARSREFGMLRHIGVLKRQIVAELASEGALLGVLGAFAGGVLGLAMSQVLIHVVNPQSFHWTMDTAVPWTTLAIVGLALVVAAAGTAVIAGRRALAHDAVMAVREDW